MDNRKAIIGFSQCEKVKGGIIWISQTLELTNGLNGHEKQGAEKSIRVLVEMLVQEVGLAKNITQDPIWDEVEEALDKALLMINSGIAAESVHHMTQALSHVTTIGQRAMTYLQKEGLI